VKVCYFGTYRANYSRNQIMMAGLREAGVEVIECHVPLWQGIEDRVQTASGGWASFTFIKRLWSTYTQLLTQYFALDQDYDLMILGYPGQLDVFLAYLLTWWYNKPLILDMLMSIYLVAIERDLAVKNPLSIKLLYFLEWFACRLPNSLIVNTTDYAQWLATTYHLSLKRFSLVSMGTDERIFKPLNCTQPTNNQFLVLYYGTFIPNHGADVIIKAAHLLKEQTDIHFQMVGDGPTKSLCQQLAQNYNLPNITFTDWLDKEQLSLAIAHADLVLGVFSETTQSKMTIHNKIYEGLAMKKPIITGFSTTIANIFHHQEHLFLVERNNPTDLAKAILTLKANPQLCNDMAETGYTKVAHEFTVATLGQRFRQHLEEIL